MFEALMSVGASEALDLPMSRPKTGQSEACDVRAPAAEGWIAAVDAARPAGQATTRTASATEQNRRQRKRKCSIGISREPDLNAGRRRDTGLQTARPGLARPSARRAMARL